MTTTDTHETPDTDTTLTDAIVARDAEATELIKRLDHAKEQLEHWSQVEKLIKARLLDLYPTGQHIGDRVVQVTHPRRLDETAFTTAYPVAQNPAFYVTKVNLKAVAETVLDEYRIPGAAVVKVL